MHTFKVLHCLLYLGCYVEFRPRSERCQKHESKDSMMLLASRNISKKIGVVQGRPSTFEIRLVALLSYHQVVLLSYHQVALSSFHQVALLSYHQVALLIYHWVALLSYHQVVVRLHGGVVEQVLGGSVIAKCYWPLCWPICSRYGVSRWCFC